MEPAPVDMACAYWNALRGRDKVFRAEPIFYLLTQGNIYYEQLSREDANFLIARLVMIGAVLDDRCVGIN